MRLNQASDFALRILMLLAQNEQPLTVDELTFRLGLAKSHTMKIIAKMSRAGLVKTRRGRIGGVTLGRSADTITVGEVVRLIEADFATVECLAEKPSLCHFLPGCALKGVMIEAGEAFLKSLDHHTLEKIAQRTPPLQA